MEPVSVSSAVQYFINQRGTNVLNGKDREYSLETKEKIALLGKKLHEIPPAEFKQIDGKIQISILHHAVLEGDTSQKIVSYFSDELQEGLFEDEVCRGLLLENLCQWEEKGGEVVLAIKKNGLKDTKEQIRTLLHDLPAEKKEQVTTLDLKDCLFLTNFMLHDSSILTGFPNLEKLILPKNSFFKNVAGIEAVGAHLKELDLSGTGLVSLDFLKKLPILETIKATSARSLRGIKGLERCPNLKEVSLEGCSQIPSPQFAIFAVLQKLEKCNLNSASCFESTSPFAHLPQIALSYEKTKAAKGR